MAFYGCEANKERVGNEYEVVRCVDSLFIGTPLLIICYLRVHACGFATVHRSEHSTISHLGNAAAVNIVLTANDA